MVNGNPLDSYTWESVTLSVDVSPVGEVEMVCLGIFTYLYKLDLIMCI